MKVSREQMAENRRRILDAAGRLFREKGFDSVSVAEVMKAAGLTHGGFYGHFASKDDLVAQTLAHVLAPSTGGGDLRAYLDAYLSPEVQLAFATELFWSPTNKTVKVPADVAKKIITGPADVDKLVLFDWAQVAKQRPQWTEKWNKEMR